MCSIMHPRICSRHSAISRSSARLCECSAPTLGPHSYSTSHLETPTVSGRHTIDVVSFTTPARTRSQRTGFGRQTLDLRAPGDRRAERPRPACVPLCPGRQYTSLTTRRMTRVKLIISLSYCSSSPNDIRGISCGSSIGMKRCMPCSCCSSRGTTSGGWVRIPPSVLLTEILVLNKSGAILLTDSTFADQFYGMRYRSSLPDRPSARPSSKQKALILAFIVSLSCSCLTLTLLYRLVIYLT